MRLVTALHELVQIADSPGGHIVILMALVSLGVYLQVYEVEYGKELTSGSLGALFAVLRYQPK